MPAVRVTEAELDQLFDQLDVWRKADDGRLVSAEEAGARAPARLCAGGESYFLRLRNAAGLAVARVHYIDCPDGRTLRWPSALPVGDVTLFRSGHDIEATAEPPAT